jgi:hypothetical protein
VAAPDIGITPNRVSGSAGRPKPQR